MTLCQNIEEKLTNAPYLRKLNKKLLAVLDCVALNNKGQPSILKAAQAYVFGMCVLPT